MRPKLLILGTGPHAVEMTEIVSRVNRIAPSWDLVGLVAATEKGVGEERGRSRVIGGPEALAEYPDAYVVPEYGWPTDLLPGRERWTSLVDPTAFVSGTARIGVGCVVYPNCFAGAGAQVGDCVFCLSGSVVNHDDVVEDRVTLAAHAVLAGEVHVEEGCYLGQCCTVKQKVRIGRGSIIGMGAVVIADVQRSSVMVGNPARRLRAVDTG
jgi:sugar O-acyltransferase (sialic acid O-acetyltransferase NeuD family)